MVPRRYSQAVVRKAFPGDLWTTAGAWAAAGERRAAAQPMCCRSTWRSAVEFDAIAISADQSFAPPALRLSAPVDALLNPSHQPNNPFAPSSVWPVAEFFSFVGDAVKRKKKVLMLNAGVAHASTPLRLRSCAGRRAGGALRVEVFNVPNSKHLQKHVS